MHLFPTLLSPSSPLRARPRDALLIGVLPGEGAGPEIVAAALDVLAALRECTGLQVNVREAGSLGMREGRFLGPFAAELRGFCDQVFADGGVLLCGAGGGRFVYHLRRAYQLFCKLVPVRPLAGLAACRSLREEVVGGCDLVVVRENISGYYFAQDAGERDLQQTVEHSRQAALQLLQVACELAASRRRRLAVVVKDGGLPGLTRLWKEAAWEAAAPHDLEPEFLNVDYAAYRLLQAPCELDVLAAPNLFGDVLADVSALLLGARSVSFSGNFAATGAAVYQTNHGSAWDLRGRDRANPIGQILALAMLLRESFGCVEAAGRIERAVEYILRQGCATPELSALPGPRIGTRELGRRVAAAVLHDAASPCLGDA